MSDKMGKKSFKSMQFTHLLPLGVGTLACHPLVPSVWGQHPQVLPPVPPPPACSSGHSLSFPDFPSCPLGGESSISHGAFALIKCDSATWFSRSC